MAATVESLLDQLAHVPLTGQPFLSVYVDARVDDTGRNHWSAEVRKELGERAKSYRERTPAREAFEADAARVLAWLASEARPSANGIVVFACESATVFEAVQLDVPLAETEIVVGVEPHLYPLARLADQYRRWAVVVTDRQLARIFVMALGRIEARGEIAGVEARGSMAGGWSQARYQRHIENYHLHHIKEVVQELERIVRLESIEHVAIGGEESALTLLRDQLPKSLASMVTELSGVGVHARETDILREALEAARERDAQDDADRVARMYDAYRAGGLGMVGVTGTRAALERGQVHELLIVAQPDRLEGVDGPAIADDLVAKARQTSARVVVIDDAALLAEAGGVGALLRYRLNRRAA
jgi:peptide chain release factor subunit 1